MKGVGLNPTQGSNSAALGFGLCICYTMAARGLRVVHEWLSFDRPRGRSPSGLSKLKPRVCNPVDHKQRHRIK